MGGEGRLVFLTTVMTRTYSDLVVAELKSCGRRVKLSSMKMRSTFFVEFGTIGDLTELLLRKSRRKDTFRMIPTR